MSILVSIPIGFSHQLRPTDYSVLEWLQEVSIPIGFSHQLRQRKHGTGTGQPPSFNPYRVFSSAETSLPPLLPAGGAVSIPIGFSHQLRLFLLVEVFAPVQVSIPIGFSHQLRPICFPVVTIIISVSIPIGFSHQLRPNYNIKYMSTTVLFQSLLGFLIS